MMYLRDKVPGACATITGRTKSQGAKHYYVEETNDVLQALNDHDAFWAWYRTNYIK